MTESLQLPAVVDGAIVVVTGTPVVVDGTENGKQKMKKPSLCGGNVFRESYSVN